MDKRKSDIEEAIGQSDELATNKRSVKISAIEMADIIYKRKLVRLIDGQLHWFNGFYYMCTNRTMMERYIVQWMEKEYPKQQSYRLAKECATLLACKKYENEKPAESGSYLCLYRGIINLNEDRIYPENEYDRPWIPVTYRIMADIPPLPLANIFPYTDAMDAFLSDITKGNALLIQRIWEMIGYLLSPDTKGKVFFILQGETGSGKSVLGRVISSYFEDHKVRRLDIEQLGKRNATSALMNMCLNLSMDLPNKTLPPLAIRNIKLMTGNDDVEVEFRPGVYGKYYGRCKFLFATNHPLRLTGFDKGFTSRIVCIPFHNAIPKEKQDYNLYDKLIEERNTIFIKAMKAYKRLVKNNYVFSGEGTGTYEPLIRYLPTDAENRNEIICEFVDKCCCLVPIVPNEKGTYTQILYSAYLKFCEENCYTPINTAQGFAQSLRRNFKDSVEHTRWREGNENKNGFRGIGLISIEYDA